MTTRHWTISTELSGVPRQIDVYLYDDLGTMRRAAMSFGKKIGEEIERGHFDSALAVTHGFRRYHIDADGTETELPDVSVLRLTRGYTSPEVVSHEVGHLAQWLYRLDVLNEDPLPLAIEHYGADNELFCYMLGGLFATVWEMLAEER